jgi:hypothetical protein
MQDRYAGDAGDWSKLGLLRALRGTRTGVVWYRVADEAHNADGKHVQWAGRPGRYRPQDPELFDALAPFAAPTAERSVALLAERACPGWASFEELVPAGPERRAAWLQRALAAVAGCDVVCLDPDNGLTPASVRPTSRAAPKFAADSEVAAFAAAAPVLVVYQHLHRRGTAGEQAEVFAGRLATAAGRPCTVLRYRRGTSRLYGVVAPADHPVRGQLAGFVERWAPDFELSEEVASATESAR